MGWLANKFSSWAVKTQKAELEAFINNLKGLDSHEISSIVALATDGRHKLEEMYGWDFLDPVLLEASDPYVTMKINQLIRQMQKQGDTVDAAALMVWLHTLRSATTLELRMLGRELWRQLERGFATCVDTAADMSEVIGTPLNTEGYNQFPAGLTPDPL